MNNLPGLHSKLNVLLVRPTHLKTTMFFISIYMLLFWTFTIYIYAHRQLACWFTMLLP